MNNFIDAEKVKIAARGHCLGIIAHLAPQLAHACGSPGKHVKCPCHGEKDGFRLAEDANETGVGHCNLNGTFANIFLLLQWTNSWTFIEALEAVAQYLRLGESSITPIIPIVSNIKPTPTKDYVKEKRTLEKYWNETIPDNGRIAEYFRHRRLTIPVPGTLRLHPNLYYYHQVSEGIPPTYYPAMIGKLILKDKCVGLHITFLDPTGPGIAPCSNPRKLRTCYKYCAGAAIQLFQTIPDKPLILGEGIENCLAVWELTGFPVWSALNTSFLKTVDVPPESNLIFIAGDLDKSGAGQRAVDALSKKLHAEDKEVYIAYPTDILPDGVKSIDWNDKLLQEREEPYDKFHNGDIG